MSGTPSEPPASAAYSLRLADMQDAAFLLAVYASTRVDEMALVDWPAEQKQSFVLMQYNAQFQHYARFYPAAVTSIIMRGETAIGRLIVDRQPDMILIMDIALLPEYRQAGTGSAIIRDLMAEARLAGKPLRLHVETFNPALRLYQRLGFQPVSQMGIYLEMEWRPEVSQP